MASSFFPLLFFLPLLFLDPLFCKANLHHSKTFLRSSLISQPLTNATILPTLFFEVTKPINVPTTTPCTLSVLQHDFGFTYGKPPVLANYSFPSNCPYQELSKIVLEWNATCKGRQFDRIFGVWLSGVELLRSCTAEPRATGIIWSVKKDITRYSSLLLSNKTQTFAVYMGNLVDKTYTGVYHVNVTLYFYPAVEKMNLYEEKARNLGSGFGSKADLIIPFSLDLPLNDGLWYEIENSTDVKVKEFEIPQNVYRAVLEVYVSFHENDEFWYGNLPNEYIAANNLTGFAGNGPFREVVVSLDDEVVGAIWPFTVVYTGGINPLLWRPISGIGSFDLPTYDIEISPFLGSLLDGKKHKLSFGVTNALNVWYIDANLHLWLDSNSAKTEGKLLQHKVAPLAVSSVLDFKGLNGTFVTNTSRFVSSTGWVKSTYGTVTTESIQDLRYSNSMLMGKDGNLQIVNQTIHFDDSVYAKSPASNVESKKSLKRFHLYLYSDDIDQGNGTLSMVANVTLGFNEKKFKDADARSPSSSLRNLQKGKGVIIIKDNLVVSGVGILELDNQDSCIWILQINASVHGFRLCEKVLWDVASGGKITSINLAYDITKSNYRFLFNDQKTDCRTSAKLQSSVSQILHINKKEKRMSFFTLRSACSSLGVQSSSLTVQLAFHSNENNNFLGAFVSSPKRTEIKNCKRRACKSASCMDDAPGRKPWEAFRPDGVIIFSDILTPLPAFGVPFDIEEVRGPVIQSLICSEDCLKALHPIDLEKLHSVGESLKILRQEVGDHAAVLGFVGAPWTIATYIVEGGTTRTYTTVKSMCHTAPNLLRDLLCHLTKAISEYIIYQVESRVHCIQRFDSWGGQLPLDMWEQWSKPYITEIVSIVQNKCPKIPLVLYINGNGGLLERMKGTGVDVIGLDWTVDMADGRKRLGNDISVQGNVDPAYLFSPLPAVTEEIQRVVKCAGPRGHILNLGHGVLVGTPEEAVAHFFEVTKSLKYDSSSQNHAMEKPKLLV
ncbi:hypothetical protein ES332_A01G066800v1 [Gossypium tomentosum]|uniref:uroporphyrinogen decarboxylase n=1 Tax=Gossypium tomentosum TaxID=34277 RepID=A0A5D2RNG4_GOSTO|nr:hypothetical protein ES332_A01G066800v1 [Gossypium tomentosum]